MQQVAYILNKELKDFFISPIAYIVMAVFLLVTGWLFFSAFFVFDQADMRNFFNLLPMTFAFVIPAITMRLFAEELSSGSYETLLTLPVTFRDIILGKYLAGVSMVAAMLVPTLSYPIFISFMGELDWGPVIGGLYRGPFHGGGFYGRGPVCLGPHAQPDHCLYHRRGHLLRPDNHRAHAVLRPRPIAQSDRTTRRQLAFPEHRPGHRRFT